MPYLSGMEAARYLPRPLCRPCRYPVNTCRNMPSSLVNNPLARVTAARR